MLSNQDLPGTLKSYGGVLPPDHLLADGSAVSRTLYADLFAAIGITHGPGDGSTTFNIPESRGRAEVGSGTGPSLSTRTLGQKFGEESHQLSLAEMPSHNHGGGNHGHGGTYARTNVAGGHFINGGGSDTDYNGTIPASGTIISSQGSDGFHNNMQPSLVVTKMVRY